MGIARVFRYLVGLDSELKDARPAWLSVGITRIAIFIAVLMCYQTTWYDYFGDDTGFERWHASKVGAAYYPFGILKFWSDAPPSLEFLKLVKLVAVVSTPLAIIGLLTRPMMIASVTSVLLLVLLAVSDSYFWSHSWNVIFLAAIPFAFCNAGSSLSVDHFLSRRFARYPFGRRTEPVLWGVLAAQAGAALFVFAAFYAKIVAAIQQQGWDGPFWYVFSDNMRNVLGIFWLGTPENVVPPWIEWAWSTPWVWVLLMLGHLVMQAAPAAAFFSLNKPRWRAFEGFIFLAGIIALGIVANGWNWAWVPLVACFIDWDHFLKATAREQPVFPRERLIAASTGLALFFGVFTAGWVTQKANDWGLYPYSNMSFYATFYVRAPFDEHLPYADYMIGELTLQVPRGTDAASVLPDHWCNATGMGWSELRSESVTRCFRVEDDQVTFPYVSNNIHGIGRETDIDRLHQSMRHRRDLLNLDGPLPEGTRFMVWLKTAGFPAYPEPMRKKTLHAGVRGIWDPNTDQFAGMTTEMDREARLIHVRGVKGETGLPQERLVFARFNAHLNTDVLPLIPVPGKWIDDQRFEVEEAFMLEHGGKLWNGIIRTETIFGPVDFDGPVQWL